MTDIECAGGRCEHVYVVDVAQVGDRWIAKSERFGLLLEAADYDLVTERARRIVPMLAQLDGVEIPPDLIGVRFCQCPENGSRRAPAEQQVEEGGNPAAAA